MARDPIRVDVTPGAHSFLEAQATTSFTLACGCRTRMTSVQDASEAATLKHVGNTYPCSKHGDQYITRSTQRLVGWK